MLEGIDIGHILAQQGFPTLVAVWFMWRYERRMDNIIKLLTVLATKRVLDQLNEEEEGK